MEGRDERYPEALRQRKRVNALDAEMRVDQGRAVALQQALVRPRVPGDHLPADARQRPSSGEVLQRKGFGAIRRTAEPHPAEEQRLVPPQVLRLPGDEGLRNPEQIVAEDRDLMHYASIL